MSEQDADDIIIEPASGAAIDGAVFSTEDGAADTVEGDAETQRYNRAAHAMQTGVALVMNHDPKETEPKHLRVGINSAMSDQGGLARLLIAKGVFTEEEYVTALADAMMEEAQRYEARIQMLMGMPVKLV